MGTGVARVLVRYGAAGDPGDSGVDPEKTQANEEEEDDGEDEFVSSETIEDHRLLAAASRAENQFSLASKNWHLLCVTDSEAIAKFGRELAREDNILDILSFAIPDLCMLLSNFVLI
ncbi:unnamed protein product [Sphagnum jensenii]